VFFRVCFASLVHLPDYAVVIPARNAERFIASTLASVQGQSLPPRDIVVIDDGSTDRTAAVARAAGVRVIGRSTSQGPSAARNLGVTETDTPLIAFLDADDEWKPDHAELVVAALSSSAVVFAGSDAEQFGSGSGTSQSFRSDENPIDLCDMLVADNPVIQSSVIVRREAFEQSGGYDEGMFLSEDYDLWTRIAEQGLYAHVDSASSVV
jgi:glycosyltransferase involved in cell wall biosynthesis